MFLGNSSGISINIKVHTILSCRELLYKIVSVVHNTVLYTYSHRVALLSNVLITKKKGHTTVTPHIYVIVLMIYVD